MLRIAYLAVLALVTLTPAQLLGGPVEDANAVIDQWSATYSANDPDALLKLYAPDAVLLGTRGESMSIGTAGLQEYFKRLKGSGNKNRIVERQTIMLGDSAVIG